MKNVAVTLLRPEPRVMRRHLRLGFFFIGNECVSVMVSTRVMCCALFGPLVVGIPALDGALGVAARVVAQQVVDRLDAEHLVEGLRGLGAHDVVQPITQRRHDYSTPISSASPRWPVR